MKISDILCESSDYDEFLQLLSDYTLSGSRNSWPQGPERERLFRILDANMECDTLGQTFWRGMAFRSWDEVPDSWNFLKNDVITDDFYVSVTEHRGTAGDYMRYGQPEYQVRMLFEIKTMDGAKCIDVESYSDDFWEMKIKEKMEEKMETEECPEDMDDDEWEDELRDEVRDEIAGEGGAHGGDEELILPRNSQFRVVSKQLFKPGEDGAPEPLPGRGTNGERWFIQAEQIK